MLITIMDVVTIKLWLIMVISDYNGHYYGLYNDVAFRGKSNDSFVLSHQFVLIIHARGWKTWDIMSHEGMFWVDSMVPTYQTWGLFWVSFLGRKNSGELEVMVRWSPHLMKRCSKKAHMRLLHSKLWNDQRDSFMKYCWKLGLLSLYIYIIYYYYYIVPIAYYIITTRLIIF